MTHPRWLFVALALFAPTVASAHDVLLLTDVAVIDGNGSDPQPDRTVEVRDGKIAAVRGAGGPNPAGAEVVSLRGKTLMPVMINGHGHLGLLKGVTTLAANVTEENVRRQLKRYEAYGVGAVLSMGTDPREMQAMREASRRGAFPGAEIFSAGFGFGVKEGLPPATLGADSVFRPSSADEAREDVRKLAPLKPDVVKLWVDDFYGQFPTMTPEVYGAVIDEAHKAGLRVAAHVYHIDDARDLVAKGLDVIAHSVRDGAIDADFAAELKRKGVAYLPTMALDEFATAYEGKPEWMGDPFFIAALEPGVFEMISGDDYRKKVREDPKTVQEVKALAVALANVKTLYDAGVLVALGTDSGASLVRTQGFSEHEELKLLVRAGLTPLQAIRVATRNGAELLKVADRLGTIEVGKEASFVVLDRDPSREIANTRTISGVWRRGKKVSNGPLAAP